jgi:hypothetical protein
LKFCWKRQGNIEKGNIQFSFVHLGFAFVVWKILKMKCKCSFCRFTTMCDYCCQQIRAKTLLLWKTWFGEIESSVPPFLLNVKFFQSS